MVFERITSLKNDSIKNILALRERKNRDQSGLSLVDGVRELQTALYSRLTVEKIFLCPTVLDPENYSLIKDECVKRQIPVIETSSQVSEKISFGDRHQGVVGIIKTRTWKFSDLTLRKDPLLVVIERVEKPGNLGAILRTSDAANVDAVVVCDGKTDLYNPNVIRSSLGAVFCVPVVMSNNEEVEQFLKSKRLTSWATFPDAKLTYTQGRFQGPTAIILGSEKDGLSKFWHQQANQKIQIPMYGQVNSLNVSISAAIVIYEAMRQRSIQGVS